MLDPDYLLRISEGGEEIAETLHRDILNRIIERVTLRLDRGDNYILTAQDKWQLEVLQEAGYLMEDIQKELTKATGLMQNEIAQAMEDAGVRALDYDDAIYRAAGLSPVPLTQSPHLIRLIQRTYEATMGEWTNFTRTTAEMAQQAFVQACDKAYTQVASGAVGYAQAYKEAINGIVDEGLVVTYPSGHTDTIETATLRCIRTGIGQATAQITDARMEEMDWDIILVSAHLGARVNDRQDFTNHYWWQGKFYSKSGKDKRFPPFSVCGQGNVQGIHGANCRHSHGPGDGEFNPYDHYDSEENQKEYELQQRQRALERRIRKSKREVMGYRTALDNASTDEAKALMEHEYQKASALLQKRNKAYNDFCEENDLKKLNERITIAKWDRSQAAKARSAAKRYETDFTTKQISGTIKSVSGARITNPYGKAAEEHAERYYGLVRSMSSDVSRIAKATGYPEDLVQRVKNYIFVDKHDLGDLEPRRFDPSFAMAQSWQRLIDGHPEQHDLTMIRHEIMEQELIDGGMSQHEAHIETSKKYNYGKESDDYYAALKEHNNRK